MNYIKNKIGIGWRSLLALSVGILVIIILGSQLVSFGDSVEEVLLVAGEVPAKQKGYVPAVPNYDGIQNEALRKTIDWRYTLAHDALSKAYYEKEAFVWEGVDHGILSKEKFDKAQALLWAKYEILFNEENLKRKPKDRIPVRAYDDILDCNLATEVCTVVGKKSVRALEKINQLKNEGIPNIDI